MEKIIVKYTHPADGNAHANYDSVEKKTSIVSRHKMSVMGLKNAIKRRNQTMESHRRVLGGQAVGSAWIEFRGKYIDPALIDFNYQHIEKILATAAGVALSY